MSTTKKNNHTSGPWVPETDMSDVAARHYVTNKDGMRLAQVYYHEDLNVMAYSYATLANLKQLVAIVKVIDPDNPALIPAEKCINKIEEQ